MFPTNVSILKVERSAALNRYAEPQRNTVYKNLRGNMETTSRMGRSSDGETATIDGVLLLEELYELKSADLLTIDNRDQDQFMVFGSSDVHDLTGNLAYRTYDLTKVA